MNKKKLALASADLTYTLGQAIGPLEKLT